MGDKKTKNVIKKVLGIIYPKRCPICGEIVSQKEQLICGECKNKLVYIKNPRCKKCGKPLEFAKEEYCRDCKRRKHYFEEGRAVWLYSKEMRSSIYRFKYDNKREYAEFYTEELVRIYGSWIKRLQIDAIVPIPLHEKRKKIRGFNQAEVLANQIGEKMNLPVMPKLMIRQKNTIAQKELNDKERQENVKNAFKIPYNEVQLKKVLLVDDIYTTGSTIDAAAKALKGKGVEKVYYICLCTGGVN